VAGEQRQERGLAGLTPRPRSRRLHVPGDRGHGGDERDPGSGTQAHGATLLAPAGGVPALKR
jgi:hypothetical protein